MLKSERIQGFKSVEIEGEKAAYVSSVLSAYKHANGLPIAFNAEQREANVKLLHRAMRRRYKKRVLKKSNSKLEVISWLLKCQIQIHRKNGLTQVWNNAGKKILHLHNIIDGNNRHRYYALLPKIKNKLYSHNHKAIAKTIINLEDTRTYIKLKASASRAISVTDWQQQFLSVKNLINKYSQIKWKVKKVEDKGADEAYTISKENDPKCAL
ncbi:MAG: hypothetical protein COC15_01805, partial [Legionellales bacterium]